VRRVTNSVPRVRLSMVTHPCSEDRRGIRRCDPAWIRTLAHYWRRGATFGGRRIGRACVVSPRFLPLSLGGLLINDVEIGPERIPIGARCWGAAGKCPVCAELHQKWGRAFIARD
jgi:hypothetical protein